MNIDEIHTQFKEFKRLSEDGTIDVEERNRRLAECMASVEKCITTLSSLHVHVKKVYDETKVCLVKSLDELKDDPYAKQVNDMIYDLDKRFADLQAKHDRDMNLINHVKEKLEKIVAS